MKMSSANSWSQIAGVGGGMAKSQPNLQNATMFSQQCCVAVEV